MKSGEWFPYMLVGLLMISVGSNVYLFIRATNDPSFAVEPNYYDKAVRWDETQEVRAKSEALGWHAELRAEPSSLELILSDAFGRPVVGAEVEVVAFHNARANERIRAELVEQEEGRYLLVRAFPRPGLWEYRLAAVRDEDTFVHVTQQELP